jgi:hypothetical protein
LILLYFYLNQTIFKSVRSAAAESIDRNIQLLYGFY